MFFELIGSSYEFNEILYIVGHFAVASLFAVWLHAVGHRIMQAICMGKDFDKSVKESINPLRVFQPKNLFAVAVLFVFSFTKLDEVNAPCLSRFRNMLISFSGVLANFFWAFAAMVGYEVLVIMEWNEVMPEYGTFLQSFLIAFVSANLAIAIFNIMPLPSLDGGVFIAQFMPEKTGEIFLSWRRYSVFIITIAIVFLSRSGIAEACIGGVSDFFGSFILNIAQTYFNVNLY
jgi:Zn-dependent protease